jgi:acyl-CoA thioesterase FadM
MRMDSCSGFLLVWYHEIGVDFFAPLTAICVNSDFSIFSFILAHISCDYLRPITLDTQLSIEIWVKEIGIKSFGLGYKLADLADASITYATGKSVQVCFDYGDNKPVAVSASLKQKLIEYQ